MPDRRRHRGQHPEDARLFGPAALPALRAAVADFSWLLARGYAESSALALVGNRYQLHDRQRQAVLRSACSDAARRRRAEREVPLAAVAGRGLAIDGYNLLITVESALSGGLVIESRDGTYRDLASIHGTYRKVEETAPALRAIGRTLASHGVSAARWYLDAPVSNSGRLRAMLLEVAREHGWTWTAELADDPDRVLPQLDTGVAPSDRLVLERCAAWTNLARTVIDAQAASAWIVDLSRDDARRQGD